MAIPSQKPIEHTVEEFERLIALTQSQAEVIESQAARLLAYEKGYEGIEIPAPPIARIEPRHLDRKEAKFENLPRFDKPVRPERPLRVCIITPDIVGPVRNGGIGTAYRYVADLLTAGGHQVTILYVLGKHSEIGPIEDWVAFYAKRGVTFVPMPNPDVETGKGENGRAVRFAYNAYMWLKDQADFDLVHLTEWRGSGYYCMLAKRLGVAFANTLFCVKCSSPTMWNRAGGSTYMESHTEIATSFMERRSVELGDVVVSGSLHLLRWMLEHGYNPDRSRCHVQPNIMLGPEGPPRLDETGQIISAKPSAAGETGTRRRHNIEEIVFFGRLEPRKGIQIFCDAITRLAATPNKPRKIVFLGKVPNNFPAREYIGNQAQSWPFEYEIIDQMSQLEVVDFLNKKNRLAVIASLLENSSFAIYECLLNRIPFILCNTGGSPELIDPSDHGEVLFEPHPGDLQKRLTAVLQQGAVEPVASFDNDQNNQIWLDWHASLTKPGMIQSLSSTLPEPEEKTSPLVSVCIAHYNRAKLVRQAIYSIKQQSYANIEVVLVDDGSPGPDNARFLDDLEQEFAPLGWQVIRQENQFVSAARNNAVRHARGEYVLFMDDDNVAAPDEIETFVRIAQRSGADILTCFANYFDGDEAPDFSAKPLKCFAPLGASVGFGFFANGFGDCNALIRKDAFEALDGFRTEYRVGKEDHEFFARAVLRGYQLEVVPLPLFWYRKPKDGVKTLHYAPSAGILRVASPFIDEVPLAYRNILLYAKSLQNRQESRRQQKVKFIAPPESISSLSNSIMKELLRRARRTTLWRMAHVAKKHVKSIGS